MTPEPPPDRYYLFLHGHLIGALGEAALRGVACPAATLDLACSAVGARLEGTAALKPGTDVEARVLSGLHGDGFLFGARVVSVVEQGDAIGVRLERILWMRDLGLLERLSPAT